MRAYQRAGSFARLPERWKKKREAFIKRHMAQGRNEQLWKGGQPSRRALALLMWAYMPPGRRSNPGDPRKRMVVYHGTSKAAARNIAKRGVDMTASTLGYFGEGFYTTENKALAKSNYADFAEDDEPGVILAFEVSPNARLLDLRKERDWLIWRDGRFADLIHRPGFSSVAVQAGIDGLYDESFEGWVFYNPDVLTLLKSNPSKKVTVYHHTSPQKAAQISKTGRLKSAGEPHVYVTNWPHPDTGYGSAVVVIRVPEHRLQLDDEFPTGRQDFRISVGRSGGSLPVEVVAVNPQDSFRFILDHPHEPTYYEFHQPTPRSRVRRTKYEWDGFSTNKRKLKTVTKQSALTEIQRKINGGWTQRRGNPGKVIRPGTDYFRKAGEMKRQLQAAQEDIYKKTGRWLTEKELLDFIHEHNIRARRAQIRRVK
jgi:hypothetical protein